MKVTGQNPPRTGELTQGKTREAEARRQPVPGRSTQNPVGVGVIATPTLTTAKALDVIRNEPDVRADKVADVKRRIQEGSYTVDADRLAKNLINTSLREDLEKP